MPGPISDSYDPEFGTEEKGWTVHEALREVLGFVEFLVDGPPKDIETVARGLPGALKPALFSERSLRLLRFAVIRTMEDL